MYINRFRSSGEVILSGRESEGALDYALGRTLKLYVAIYHWYSIYITLIKKDHWTY